MNFSGAMLLLAVTLVGSVLQLPGVGGGAQIASFVALDDDFWRRAGARGRHRGGALDHHICRIARWSEFRC